MKITIYYAHSIKTHKFKRKLYKKILYLFSSTLINSLLVPSVDDVAEGIVTIVCAGDDGGVRTSASCPLEVVGKLLIAIKKIWWL